MLKRIALVAVVIICCGALNCGSKQNKNNAQGNETQPGTMYVGSAGDNIYCYPTCTIAKQIRPEDLVRFKSAADARSKGYRPCRICKPPLQDP
jgi:methylphosphotriester-DNA--protein-cysteine methyltransferase